MESALSSHGILVANRHSRILRDPRECTIGLALR
jgi:hypothetical protein